MAGELGMVFVWDLVGELLCWNSVLDWELVVGMLDWKMGCWWEHELKGEKGTVVVWEMSL